MKCLSCGVNNAIKDPTYGVLPCLDCRSRQKMKVNKQVEFTSEDIKEKRKEFADDIIQPFRKGVLSKEYIELHGAKNIQATPEEVKKAKYVWKDEKYYN
jgi:hypothetical protein